MIDTVLIQLQSYSTVDLGTKLVRNDPMKQASVTKEEEVVKVCAPFRLCCMQFYVFSYGFTVRK